ncbi:type III pantothenate kinase [bacterium]|nr:type III pantothenate kinase [bacterium]
MDTLLCIDIGNSRLKARCWSHGPEGDALSLEGGDVDALLDALAPLLAAAEGRVGLCSVRPSLGLPLARALRARGAQLREIRGDSPAPFPVAVAQRETLGADRLCNAAAAWAASLAPALVIDAGTAVTVDLVDAGGVYRGGAILPGQSLTLRALGAGAEQLFEARPDWPPSPWGRDSAEALAAGALWGGLAALEGLALRYRADWGDAAPVILTGGAAPGLAARWAAGACRLEPDWTLRGVAALCASH